MPNWFTGIVALANAFMELAPALRGLVSLYKDAKAKGWIKDGSEIQSAISAAKTDDERMFLARRLFEHTPR